MLDVPSPIGLAFFGIKGLGMLQYSVSDGLNINVTYWLQTYGAMIFFLFGLLGDALNGAGCVGGMEGGVGWQER